MAERLQFDTQPVFLVSGGGRGITAQCAVRLAEQVGGTYLLLGRSALDATEPAWAQGCADEVALKSGAIAALRAEGATPKPADVRRIVKRVLAYREITETLRAIEAVGAKAVYLSADVRDPAALRTALQTTPAGAHVTGILHGAGILADKLIEQKTPDDFDLVYGTKVRGIQALLACVPPEQLRYLVLFSSVAGFYGNVGQADYALANEVLNKLAHRLQREYPACHVVAVDWGPWDGGMVTPALKRLFEERNVTLIPPDVGTDLLADELAREPGVAQIVVGAELVSPAPEPDSELQTYRIRRHLKLDANPFLRDHVIGGHAVLPTVCAIAWMANACENLYPGYGFACVDDYRALKGIVFDETLVGEYILSLEETAKSFDHLRFDAMISSEVDGKPRFHYRAQITLCRETAVGSSEAEVAPSEAEVALSEAEVAPSEAEVAPSEAEVAPSEAEVAGRIPLSPDPDVEHLTGDALYHGNTLFHGPSFRGVEQVLSLTERGMELRCRLPELSPKTQGQFPVQTFNPYLADAQLQSLLIWAMQVHGVVGLPLRIQKGELFRQVRFGEVSYVTLAVQSFGEHSLVADVTVRDANGLLCSRVSGAEITLSERLLALFEQNQLSKDA